MIWDAILSLIWWLLIQGPLSLIASFDKVLDYLTGGIINDILFGSTEQFSWNKIPVQFWWFVIIAIVISSLIFVIQMTILMFQEAAETKTKFVIAIQNGLKAFIFIFLIPIFFFIANFIIQNLASSIKISFTKDANLANYLWHIGDSLWDGSNNSVPEDYGPPDNIDDYNMIAQIFGTWTMLITILVVGMILVQKIIELFFLFVVAPIVMIVMVIDNGKAAFMWKDMVIAKFLASTATLTGYYIFMAAINVLIVSGMPGLQIDGLARSLFLILFLCGGGFAATGFSNIVAHFIGESVGISETASSMKGTLMGALALARPGIAKMRRGLNKKGKKPQKKKSAQSNDNSTSSPSNDSVANERIDFNPFRNATNAMASRSGISGLVGEALGSFGSSAGGLAAKAVNATQSFLNIGKRHQKKSNANNDSNTSNSNISIIKENTKKISPQVARKKQQHLVTKGLKTINSPNKPTRVVVSKRFYNTPKKKQPYFSAKQPKAKVMRESEMVKMLSPRERYNYELNKKVNRHQSKSAKAYKKNQKPKR